MKGAAWATWCFCCWARAPLRSLAFMRPPAGGREMAFALLAAAGVIALVYLIVALLRPEAF